MGRVSVESSGYTEEYKLQCYFSTDLASLRLLRTSLSEIRVVPARRAVQFKAPRREY